MNKISNEVYVPDLLFLRDFKICDYIDISNEELDNNLNLKNFLEKSKNLLEFNKELTQRANESFCREKENGVRVRIK